jgi:hypothetical protein
LKKKVKISEIKLSGVDNIDDIGEIIKEAIENDLMDRDESTMITVGKITEELRQRYQQWSNAKEDFEDEVEYKANQLKKQFARQMEELFTKRHSEFEEQKELLWEEIQKEIGVTDDVPLSIDIPTGEIKQKMENSKVTPFNPRNPIN